jgi:uracil-DNA glycosylase
MFDKKKKSPVTKTKTYSCATCGLYKECNSPRIKPYGNFRKGILIIGEAPGEMEDRLNLPFQGKAGKHFQKILRSLEIDLFEDCLSTNALLCRPTDKKGNTRTPLSSEIAACRKNVFRVIEENEPTIIILLGGVAIQSVIGHRWKKDLGGITKWRGFAIPDQDLKTWVCPVFHPTYILEAEERQANSYNQVSGPPVEEVIWKQDIRNVLETFSKPFPIYKEPEIEIITDLHVLDNIRTEFAFDYETTGLKPHAPGHRIVCCAVATSENHAYVFMMPKTPNERKPFTDLLKEPLYAKIAQNMKFEDAWSRVRLKQEVKNWAWDTMLATHTLDNRQGITGLKFQTYVNFGVIDYDSEIAPYLKSVEEKNANSLNRILELVAMEGGPEKLMKYCGYDAINEFRLAKKQRDLIYEFVLPF